MVTALLAKFIYSIATAKLAFDTLTGFGNQTPTVGYETLLIPIAHLTNTKAQLRA